MSTSKSPTQSRMEHDDANTTKKKFVSQIPGTKTSKSGMAYFPDKDAKSQSPVAYKEALVNASQGVLMG
jgi:hypothetical protein